jgi:hypothetical protein
MSRIFVKKIKDEHGWTDEGVGRESLERRVEWTPIKKR